MEKWHPGYFGKKGIRTFHLNKNAHFCPVVNVDKLWSLVSEETRKKYSTVKDKAIKLFLLKFLIFIIQKKQAPVIDVTKAGFFKVLGKGRLPS